MARTADPTVRIEKLPKNLPEGLEFIHCDRTITGAKDANGNTPSVKGPVKFVVPETSLAGINASLDFLNKNGPEEDGVPYGVRFVSEAIRSAIVSGVSSKLTPETLDDSVNILAPVSSVRTVDPFAAQAQAAAQAVAEAQRSGKKMSKDDLLKLYAGMVE